MLNIFSPASWWFYVFSGDMLIYVFCPFSDKVVCFIIQAEWAVCKWWILTSYWGFPGGAVVKNLPANEGDARDLGLILSYEGNMNAIWNSNLLHYSYLENTMGRGAWWVTVHRVTKSWTWLSTHIHNHLSII